jgi:16S rRNA C967 or C1407 C5-methylase (RsmB/RsmF family)
VVAADLHPHRLRAMREQLKRINLAQVTLVNLDATKPLPFRIGFDRILVDAPCSGTGTLSRHPEIRWRLRPEQLPELHQLQVTILCRALEGLAPGGRLVYSTCSLEPDENEEVVAEALSEKTESIKHVAGPTVRHARKIPRARGSTLRVNRRFRAIQNSSGRAGDRRVFRRRPGAALNHANKRSDFRLGTSRRSNPEKMLGSLAKGMKQR